MTRIDPRRLTAFTVKEPAEMPAVGSTLVHDGARCEVVGVEIVDDVPTLRLRRLADTDTG